MKTLPLLLLILTLAPIALAQPHGDEAFDESATDAQQPAEGQGDSTSESTAEDARPEEGTILRRNHPDDIEDSEEKLDETFGEDEEGAADEVVYNPSDTNWFTYPDFPVASFRYRYGYDEEDNQLHDFDFGIAQEVLIAQRTGQFEMTRALRPSLNGHVSIGEISDRTTRRLGLISDIAYHWDVHGGAGETIRTEFPYLRTANFHWDVGAGFGLMYSEELSPQINDDLGLRVQLHGEIGFQFVSLQSSYAFEFYEDAWLDDFEVNVYVGQPSFYGSVFVGYRFLRQPDEDNDSIHHSFTIGLRFLV